MLSVYLPVFHREWARQAGVPREHSFAGCRWGYYKGLQAGGHHFFSVGTSDVFSHTGTQYGDGTQ